MDPNAPPLTYQVWFVLANGFAHASMHTGLVGAYTGGQHLRGGHRPASREALEATWSGRVAGWGVGGLVTRSPFVNAPPYLLWCHYHSSTRYA